MPIAAALSTKERQDVLRHCGFPTLEFVTSVGLGVPALSQAAFVLMQNAANLNEDQVAQCRQYLNILDGLNNQLVGAVERLQAKKVGEIELNPDELDAIDREYYRWACILADLLGGWINSYSARFKRYSQGINRSVVHD